MSRLDELIQEMCLDGVEYCLFEDVCQYVRGITYNKHDEINIDGVDGECVLRANNITLESNTVNFDDVKRVRFGVKIKDTQRLKKNDILICAGSGSKEHIGKVAFIDIDSVYTFGGFMGVIRCDKTRLEPRYLFHIMTSPIFKNHLRKVSGGNSSTINNINNDTWKNFEVPVPPLEVQREIVRVLDNFTLLRAELSAELSARRKQYDEYLNKLLDIATLEPSKIMSVGELFEIKNGLNKEKSAFGKGTPIVNFTDVFNKRYLTADMIKGKVTLSENEIERYRVRKGDVFFTRTSETKEEIGMSSTVVDDIPDCTFSGFILRARPLTGLLIPKFCAYYFSTNQVRDSIIRYASFTTRATTSGSKLSKIPVPIIPISEQERIVSILDRFDILCTDISSGLPAEIEARTKQYEYYRDKLLSFKRKETA